MENTYNFTIQLLRSEVSNRISRFHLNKPINVVNNCEKRKMMITQFYWQNLCSKKMAKHEIPSIFNNSFLSISNPIIYFNKQFSAFWQFTAHKMSKICISREFQTLWLQEFYSFMPWSWVSLFFIRSSEAKASSVLSWPPSVKWGVRENQFIKKSASCLKLLKVI